MTAVHTTVAACGDGSARGVYPSLQSDGELAAERIRRVISGEASGSGGCRNTGDRPSGRGGGGGSADPVSAVSGESSSREVEAKAAGAWQNYFNSPMRDRF